jgi:predicted metal-dependent hydrolase
MTYSYSVIYSKRRTLALEITKDAQVLVRAPLRTPKRTVEEMVSRHAAWIDKHLEQQRQRASAMPEISAEEAGRLRARAVDELPPRVQNYARLMGLDPAGITITSAAKRFGSCSPKNRLSFSWRLMRYPEAAVEYVVVHELAHIRHKNHGKAFYALIESVLPDYKARRKLLKD